MLQTLRAHAHTYLPAPNGTNPSTDTIRSILEVVYGHTDGQLQVLACADDNCKSLSFKTAKDVESIVALHSTARTLYFDLHASGRLCGITIATTCRKRAETFCGRAKPHCIIKSDKAVRLFYAIEDEQHDVEAFLVECREDNESDTLFVEDDLVLPIAGYEVGEINDISPYAVNELRPLFATPTSVSKLNDADVYGTISDDVLNLQVKISSGRSQDDKVWKTSEPFPFSTLLNILTDHKAGEKNGNCFVTGALADTRRVKSAVTELHLLGLDVDSGASMDSTFKRLQDMGIFAVLYSTHSHGKSEIDIKQTAFYKFMKKEFPDEEIVENTENVKRYLTHTGKYEPSVIGSAEYVETRHIESGLTLTVRTKPFDRFRVIFPLKEPYVISKQKMSQDDAVRKWSGMVLGMGKELGIAVDRAAVDPSRLFFLPRHKKGSDNHRVLVNADGALLDWNDIKVVGGLQTLDADPFRQAGALMSGNSQARLKTPTMGADLVTWAARRADGFEIGNVFEDHCPDRLRRETATGKYVCECPFDDDHSNPGDPEDAGCFIESASANGNGFRFHCSHDACTGRDRLHLLLKAMTDGWFPDEVINDADYDSLIRDDNEKELTVGNGITLDAKGELKFAKSCRFKTYELDGKPVFGVTKQDEEGEAKTDALCQAFRVVGVAADAMGSGASITLQFDTRHNDTREVTFSRAMLFDRQDVIKLLAGKWFECHNPGGTLDLLKAMVFPIDTLNVERTGWHEGAFLHPGGRAISAMSSVSPRKLRLNSNPSGDWRGGTLEGWQSAIAVAFENDGIDREHFALSVMAGCAGLVADFVGTAGFPILNLHGNTSRGKSTSLKLAASACGAPNQKGAYHGLRKTDNGMESILSGRSGITMAFDEGKTTTAETLEKVIWMMAEGVGKTRATAGGEARVDQAFSGFAITANELPLAQMMTAAKKSQPGGFHARVCDLDVSAVPELVGEEKDQFFAAMAEIKTHYGHAWEPVVRRLQAIGAEHVNSELNRLCKELSGKNANAFTARSANALAFVWYSGTLMQDLGLIPEGNLERVVRWAWQTRAVESTLDPFTRAAENMLSAVATRRGFDILEWEYRDERYREAVAFILMDGAEELLLVPRIRLSELCGGQMSGDTIRDQMAARNLLVLSGKKTPKPRWSQLPDRNSIPHYRIKLRELAKVLDE
ncbi:DUF927 domain-containing protein [Shinella sp.]|uniref:DUF927 domain-containing protein n=1 Tax=Shinella sp. TaxID=1870904 RepID=UPI0029B5F7EA|nr:DUF927 domain-containing protein [Shinella sp.]MDX3976002.1 DUF927 domain-containing protein [Shinella sp.]